MVTFLILHQFLLLHQFRSLRTVSSSYQPPRAKTTVINPVTFSTPVTLPFLASYAIFVLLQIWDEHSRTSVQLITLHTVHLDKSQNVPSLFLPRLLCRPDDEYYENIGDDDDDDGDKWSIAPCQMIILSIAILKRARLTNRTPAPPFLGQLMMRRINMTIDMMINLMINMTINMTVMICSRWLIY